MAYDDYTALRVDVAAGIATVTLDNPPINLFDLTLYTEMARLADELAADDEARVVVLRLGQPGVLHRPLRRGADPADPLGLPTPTELHAFHLMCERFRTMPKATIAVVEGRVGGGGSELALSCDMRFAAIGRATFNQPEVALGILPGGSGTVRLARLIGRSRTMEVVLGCDDVDAELAERWGWVNRALPPEELWPFVDRLAARIAGFPPHAVREAKAAVLRGEKEVEADLLAEAGAFNRTLDDPAAQAAMRRFLEQGGQTRDGELRLGELAGELAREPG